MKRITHAWESNKWDVTMEVLCLTGVGGGVGAGI